MESVALVMAARRMCPGADKLTHLVEEPLGLPVVRGFTKLAEHIPGGLELRSLQTSSFSEKLVKHSQLWALVHEALVNKMAVVDIIRTEHARSYSCDISIHAWITSAAFGAKVLLQKRRGKYLRKDEVDFYVGLHGTDPMRVFGGASFWLECALQELSAILGVYAVGAFAADVVVVARLAKEVCSGEMNLVGRVVELGLWEVSGNVRGVTLHQVIVSVVHNVLVIALRRIFECANVNEQPEERDFLTVSLTEEDARVIDTPISAWSTGLLEHIIVRREIAVVVLLVELVTSVTTKLFLVSSNYESLRKTMGEVMAYTIVEELLDGASVVTAKSERLAFVIELALAVIEDDGCFVEVDVFLVYLHRALDAISDTVSALDGLE